MEILQRIIRGINTPTSLFSLLSLLVYIPLTAHNWKEEDKRTRRCYSYSIIHIPHFPTTEQVKRASGRDKGKIISVLSGLCFSESFMGSISSPSSLCAGTAFNDWVFSLKSVLPWWSRLFSFSYNYWDSVIPFWNFGFIFSWVGF